MAETTGIQWTDATWNPVVGCTKVSAGCTNCYAEKRSVRLAAIGKARPSPKLRLYGEVVEGGKWNGQVRCIDWALVEPLKWRKPKMVFVCSMSDLFHPDVPFEFVDKVFAVMALCPRHTFQVLTKRPERMANWFDRLAPCRVTEEYQAMVTHPHRTPKFVRAVNAASAFNEARGRDGFVEPWPLPNVWLGTSVENQDQDWRIDELCKVEAAVRFLSLEPLLGEIDPIESLGTIYHCHFCQGVLPKGKKCRSCPRDYGVDQDPGIDWVIVGGESGPKARPCNIEWIRSVVAQCKDAGVPCYVKQLGAVWTDQGGLAERLYYPKHPKGGDPAEWPADLRVREIPGETR